MNYELTALLNKMGVPDLMERKSIRWSYADDLDPSVHGFAEVRLESSDRFLTAELRHHRKNFEDDLGIIHPFHAESFYLQARRVDDSSQFRISLLSFDGRTYDLRQSAMIELGLSLFHGRAVDISTRMVEQKFALVTEEMKKLDTAREPKFAMAKKKKQAPAENPASNVITFRPRDKSGARRLNRI